MKNTGDNNLPPILTAREFFQFLRIGDTAGYIALNRLDFPFAIRVGAVWRIPRDAMLDWLAQANGVDRDGASDGSK